ncbi:MAG: hypothetical protein WCT03_13815 [Candidatus Obscuribacterales bacterium]|jgi:hypothetical protein
MNQFATSDSAVVKAPENTGGNAAILEAYKPTDRSHLATNEQISAQTENLVNSGVLPEMPITGLFDQATVAQSMEPTSDVQKPSNDKFGPPETSEVELPNITEETKRRGLELAELIESGSDGQRVVDLIRQGLASGDLEGMILTANIELEKGENPARISSGIGREEMTYVAEDSSTIPNKIEQYNPRAGISVFSLGSSQPMLSLYVRYDPAIEGYNAPYPSAQ